MATRNITLKWDDTNVLEKGMRIYRSNSPMDILNMPIAIAELPPGTTTFIDENQLVGNTNFYRVSAFIDGHEEFSSEISIEIVDNFIYIRSTGNSLAKIDSNGSLLWQTEENISTTFVVSVDDEAFSYVSSPRRLNRVLADSTIASSFVMPVISTSTLDVGYDNVAYTTLSDSFWGTLDILKIEPNGVITYSYNNNHNASVTSLSVDGVGNVYTSSFDGTVVKSNPFGEFVYRIGSFSTIVNNRRTSVVASPKQSFVWVGQYTGKVYKYNAENGALITSTPNKSAQISKMIYHSENSLFIRYGSNIEELDENLNIVSTLTLPSGTLVYDFCIDKTKSLYVSTRRTDDVTGEFVYELSKYTNNVLEWVIQPPGGNIVSPLNANFKKSVYMPDNINTMYEDMTTPTLIV